MRGRFFILKVKSILIQKIKGFDYYLRWKGINMGKNNHIYSDITTTESYLISIGNNNTISTNVTFITHDNAIIKFDSSKTDVFGEINIGDNCFIGANAIIMPGVHIGNNTIVAAGSVVVKSVSEEGTIVGGNPARKIGNVKDYCDRMQAYAINIDGLTDKEKEEVISKCNHLKK